MYFRLSATPGSEQTLPREAPARRVVHRRPFFRQQIVGLLCGKGVEPPRGGGRPSGARESQLFFGYDSPPPWGASGPVPGGCLSTLPARRVGHGTRYSPADNRAAVWVGRGATSRPREAEWSWRVAPVCWGSCNQNMFKDPFGHYYYYPREHIYI